MEQLVGFFKLLTVRSSYPHKKVDGIVNLSTHTLTSNELQVLNLGHSFVSKPASINSIKTKRQLQRVVYNKPAIDEILDDLQNVVTPSNLNVSDRDTLNNLRNNSHIVITKADKGDSWVVLDRSDYIWECERQLSDKAVYKPLPGPETEVNIKLFKNVLIGMFRRKEISANVFKNLRVELEDLHFRIFYVLPKIHKPTSTWPRKNKIPAGRPIIGNSYSEDTEICRFIDSFLKPIVEQQPYILSNSDHLLQTIANLEISSSAILFTLDVASLYTNIPIVEGIKTVKYFFDKFPNPTRSDQSIISLLSMSLFKNDFVFNRKYYRQIKGVAMGKQYAPNFANLYMSRWEEKVLKVLPGPKPKIWLRYIDDIFGIWEGSIKELDIFIESVNKIDKNIQVSGNTSLLDVQFLDLVIFKTKDSKLASMVYLKPTSSLKLIHPKSLHPHHTKHGIIVSQITRYIKNCTFQVDFLYQLQFLFSALREQGYSRTALRLAKQKALTYSNYKVDNNGVILKGFFPCKINCSVCMKYGQVRTFLEFPGGARVISQNLICSSRNVIYIIECQKCLHKYVGETSRSVKERICQHLSNIRLKSETPVSEHFNQNDHSISDFKFFALINNSLWSDSKRKLAENKWIDKLNTLKPKGMNCDVNKVRTKFVTIPFKGRNSMPNSLHSLIDESTKAAFTTGLPLRVSLNHKHKIARQ